MTSKIVADWWRDCLQWRGRLLMGRYCHYCDEFDGLPVDETCPEWVVCHCYPLGAYVRRPA
jgi:hypothetical protein